MPNVQQRLEERVEAAIAAAFPEAGDAPALLAPAQDVKFGDYQANGAMALAKRLGKKPREVAEQVIAHLHLPEIITSPPEIAGPGFINFHLDPDRVGAELGQMCADKDDRLGVATAVQPETVVVDYSAPNLAKEMHVGHLRSTVIGDALVRMLQFAGHTVVKQNHVGDWGTQFGIVVLGMWHICMSCHRGETDYVERMLILLAEAEKDDSHTSEILLSIRNRQLEDLNADWDGEAVFLPFLKRITRDHSLSLSEMLPAYQLVNRIEALAEGTGLTILRSPDSIAILYSSLSSWIAQMVQRPDMPFNKPEAMAWYYASNLTIEACQALYDRLGILLKTADIRGESAYNDVLPDIVKVLREKGLLTESEGAQCVFVPGFTAKDGTPLPLIVQKSDEGYLYSTTDLAAIAFRTGCLPEIRNPQSAIRNSKSPHADRILYVVDARQALHFAMVFECAYQAEFAKRGKHELVHVAFGTMMGPDGKPFKTREGGTVKLMDLLAEAEERAYTLVTAKNAEDVAAERAEALSDDQKKDIARIVGIGAVKYADLAQNRTSDYVFSWDKMLSLAGNTAPYMQYAYARVRSIFRKGGEEAETHRADAGPIPLEAAEELALAKMLLRFPETLDRAIEGYQPNVLAAYLYDLAQAFTAFYEACPVLKSEAPVRQARLKLCDLVARTVRKGLDLLGIEVADRM